MENSIRGALAIKILFATAIITAFHSFSSAQGTLVPRAGIVQKGGSIGLSVGFGYNISKNENQTLDFMYGYVPRSKGGTLHILAAKFAYRPLDLKVKDIATIYPVNPGAFISYHFGRKFDISRNRDQFPKGYYWWPSALRLHVSFSNELKLNTSDPISSAGIKSLGLYSEINTNDLYFVGWFQNRKTISLPDIFKMGYGARVNY